MKHFLNQTIFFYKLSICCILGILFANSVSIAYAITPISIPLDILKVQASGIANISNEASIIFADEFVKKLDSAYRVFE